MGANNTKPRAYAHMIAPVVTPKDVTAEHSQRFAKL